MALLGKIGTLSKLLTRPDFYYLASHPAGNPRATGDNLAHARAAVDWLLKAHEVCGKKGFSKLYSLKHGWFGPYVETTGYIIPSLYDFMGADGHRKDEVAAAVRASLAFLIDNQYPDGAFGDSLSFNPLVYRTGSPMVFDTGQVIFGLLAGHRAGDDPRCLASARKAGDWLLTVQEQDGSWMRYTYSGKARTYYSRVAHSLIELWKVTGDDRYRDGALKQLRWVVAQQTPKGSFRNISFEADNLAVLHVIAYTLDGLWKAGGLLGDDRIQAAARRGAAALAGMQEIGGVLAGHFDEGWHVSDPARCLTGLAQMAEVWLLVYATDRDPHYLKAADDAIGFLKTVQVMKKSRENLYGGLTGSHPWNGRYFPWAIPNWPVKFFIDALLLREQTRRQST
jgi:uncharacterized protein YyaL (SSP411 family)